MKRSALRRLILLSGPVAAGKTTVARGIATLARSHDHVAAAIDMDEMIEMVAGSDWSAILREDRLRACRGTSSLVQSLFESGTELIAIAGSTLSPYEWDEVTRRLDPAPDVLYVLLRVSLEESVRRAQSDPTRISTKDPEYVARLAAAIDWESIRRPDVDIDTDSISVDDAVAEIAKTLEPPILARRGGRG